MWFKNPQVVLISSAVVLFLGIISYASAISVGNDLDFGGIYRIIDASSTSILGGLSVGTTTPQSAGTIFALNGIKFSDNSTQTTAVSEGAATSTSAANVSSGVFGSTIGKGNYTFQGAASTGTVLFVDASNERIGIGTAVPAYKLDVNAGARLGSGNEVMRISSGGLVGIGTTTPSYKLEVIGTFRASATSTFGSQIISTVAGGIAPLAVTSNTKVTNLNADLLDGLDSSGFGDATAANQTTILGRIGTSGDAGSSSPTTLFAGIKGVIALIGAASDAASMSTTLFAGQQYIWDNRASFGAAADTTDDIAFRFVAANNACPVLAITCRVRATDYHTTAYPYWYDCTEAPGFAGMCFYSNQ